MAVGRGRAGPASGSSQTGRGLRRRAGHIGQPRDRVRVVPPGGDGLARHPSAQSSIRIRTYRRTIDPSTDRRGEVFCARLDAKAVESSGRCWLGKQSAGPMMEDGSDEQMLARSVIEVHGAEAAIIARGNARSAALAGQPSQAKSWIRVL